MATASSSDSLAVVDWDHDRESKSDRYLSARLAAAGADFKGVAAATFALAAGVAALAWLAVGVVAEHWLVPGGLPAAARWAWFAVGTGAFAAAIVRWVVPLVRYRVNLVYAARVIEHEHPELHNDLVNAVLVKARPDAASPVVARSLERRAAKRLSALPADGVIDRTVPLRLAVALAALVAMLCIYQLAAPKSLLVSAARLLAPWSGLAPPARVSISPPRLAWRVAPDGTGADRPAQPLVPDSGTVTLVRGRQLVVETDIDGLRTGERAMLVVTPLRADGTADGSAPWQVPLSGGTPAGRMTAVLPDATRGLEQPVEFLVTAGDARSERVRVAVVDTPTLLVREVRYDYHPYTGRKPETVAWQGDLRAPEFTKVTITAEGNRPLEAAWIDPGCTGRESERKRMRIGQHDLARVSGEFPLRMNADRTGPEFASYRLAFQPRSASGGREPLVVEKLEHRVEVVADVAPEVSIEAPEDAIRVPPTAPVSIRVRAVDPDYGLARVGIETRVRGGAAAPPAWVLERSHVGPFTTSVDVVPERLGAGAGSVLEYRAVAIDTRPEKPNVAQSPWRTLLIDAAAPPPPPDRRTPPRGERGEQRDAGGRQDPGDRPRDNGASRDAGEQPEQSGQRGEGQRGEGQQGAGQKGDGQKGQNEKGQGRQGEGQAGAGRQGEGQRGEGREGQGQKGEGQKGEGQKGEGRNEAGQQGAAQRGAGQQRAGQTDGKQKGEGQKEAGQQGTQRGEAQSGTPGREDGSQQGPGEPAPRDAVAADGTNDGEAMERILDNKRRQAEQGSDREGGDASAPKSCQGSDGKPCGKAGCPSCSGAGKSGGGAGAGQKGAGQPGEGRQGEGQRAEGQTGQGRQGEGEQGEGQSGAGQQGAAQQGDGQKGQSQKGQSDGKAGQGQAGDGPRGEGQRGEGRQGQDQRGAGQEGEDRQRVEQAAGNQQGDGQKSDGQKSDGQQGAGKKGEGQQGKGRQGDVAAKERGQSGDAVGGASADRPQPGPGSEVGAGGRGGGDRGRPQDAPEGATPARRDVEWTEQDSAHARNAADLAVEHLRDSMRSGRTDVLDELGWTPEQARAFIDRWQAMRRLAGSEDRRERGEFERAVRSLGLRPTGVRSARDVPADAKGGQAEGRRSRPPAAYREQFEAYLRGAGGG